MLGISYHIAMEIDLEDLSLLACKQLFLGGVYSPMDSMTLGGMRTWTCIC